METNVKENRAKWVAALRSGEFKQTTGSLKDYYDIGYCCLGVGCVVFQKETGFGEFTDGGMNFYVDKENEKEHDEDSFLNPIVAEFFGVTKPEQKELVRLNDGDHQNFQYIANKIEAVTNELP